MIEIHIFLIFYINCAHIGWKILVHLNPLSTRPFLEKSVFVCVDSTFATRFLAIGLTRTQNEIHRSKFSPLSKRQRPFLNDFACTRRQNGYKWRHPHIEYTPH